jgi:hypothetical protein
VSAGLILIHKTFELDPSHTQPTHTQSTYRDLINQIFAVGAHSTREATESMPGNQMISEAAERQAP